MNVLSTMLKLFFEKQQVNIYDAEKQMLNLSNLAQYDDLKMVLSSINFNTHVFCQALCTCVHDLITPPPSTLLLKDNKITSLYHLARTMEEANMHASLRALSLASNEIKSTDSLLELKKFSQLIELDLRGNPLQEQSDYIPKVKKALPFLLGLDGHGITAPPLALPWPSFAHTTIFTHGLSAESAAQGMNGSTSDYDTTQQHILSFVQNALLRPLEKDPQSTGGVAVVDGVLDAYSPQAVLTLSLSNTSGAAVSTPSRTFSGENVNPQRDAVRDIVGLRLRQNESSHNVLLGVKSTQVATGRTRVCAQLEHWLYARNFRVTHYVHPSPHVVILDNQGFGPQAVVGVKQPVSVVTLHGLMFWHHRPNSGGQHSTSDVASLRNAIVIRRNFTRVLTITTADAGRWQIVNDMISLYAQGGGSLSDSGDIVGTASSPAQQDSGDGSLSYESVLLRNVHPHDIVFAPASDTVRAGRLGRRYGVPESVVLTLCQYVHTDIELITILMDLKGVTLDTYHQLAALVDNDPLAAIILGRIGNRFAVDPATGVKLLQQYNMNWINIEKALSTL